MINHTFTMTIQPGDETRQQRSVTATRLRAQNKYRFRIPPRATESQS
jgi:hypothetical protein